MAAKVRTQVILGVKDLQEPRRVQIERVVNISEPLSQQHQKDDSKSYQKFAALQYYFVNYLYSITINLCFIILTCKNSTKKNGNNSVLENKLN